VPALAAGDHVTFSAGVTERQPMEPFAEAIGRADKALYGAKTSGRNCIYPL
jgi:PleD family two-component response regulator